MILLLLVADSQTLAAFVFVMHFSLAVMLVC